MGKAFTLEERQTVIKRFLNGEEGGIYCPGDANFPKHDLSMDQGLSVGKGISSERILFSSNAIQRLERIIQILQNAPCTASAPLHERLRAIELMSREYSVKALCFALKVANGTYYNHTFYEIKGKTRVMHNAEQN